ncbi:ABC transporter ATP-binding protein [Corynebacterium caspium]|uniref:ABC transporter ATP-binding protein n=1 Tax=Corynebacterium caspium TaxID=234828 RepID=UPI00037E6F2C|nr:ABC transporter ATP-binding protein [Corynebacterium caspium]WKD59525.1 Putative HMP/thiamine import ATP-binding protein YkoD [Corynebacterium caspium DSM 44850]
MGAFVKAQGFSWRHASRSLPVLREVSFEVLPGEKVLLTGPSGSGKSTLLAAIAGLLANQDEGEQQGSLDIGDATVGMVLQDPDSQVIASRVGDDVAFGCENLRIPRDEIWPRVRQALSLVGLDLPLDHPTKRLSGGQKQRLALAGVIAMGADLILLDEPTANLDPEGQREVVSALNHVAEETGATIIIVEHNHELWSEFATKFLRVSRSGGIDEISVTELPPRPKLPPSLRAGDVDLLTANDLLTRWGPSRSFRIPMGSSTVITGRNGVGKSTLALTLAGLIPPKRGELKLHPFLADGLVKPPHKWSSKDLASRIGMVSQDPEHQFVARTVEEELMVGERVTGRENPSRRGELLERLRLTHLRDANPFSLSGGEKRRLSVGAALVVSPRLLILDEPTFGQDEETFVELVSLLREIVNSGTTVISVTHDPYFIASLGDHRVEVL